MSLSDLQTVGFWTLEKSSFKIVCHAAPWNRIDCCGIDPRFIFPFRLGSFVALSVVSPLVKTTAASQMRTPLTESAVRAFVLLIPGLFQRTDESIGRYFKTHSTFIDKLLFIIRHSL